MRGVGRMKSLGMPPLWWSSLHGPGNNAFDCYVDPFGIVVEYTVEINQIEVTRCAVHPEY